mgnify:CR=1 FL=1
MSVNVLPKFAVGDRVVILFGCNQGRRKIIRKIEKTPNNRIFYIFCGGGIMWEEYMRPLARKEIGPRRDSDRQ